MTHPDDVELELDPGSDVHTQLAELADWAQARLDDERANRQMALERLVGALTEILVHRP